MIRNVNGHAVSSVAPGDHQVVGKANLQMPDQMGKMGYNGGSGGSKGFPGARKTKGPSNAPAQGQTGVAWAAGPK